MSGETFSVEQGKISQIEVKSKQEKKEDLSKTLAQNRDTFFKQVDEGRKVMDETDKTLKIPESKQKLKVEREKVRQHLLKVADEGQKALEGKVDVKTISQLAATLKADLEQIKQVIPVYKELDKASSQFKSHEKDIKTITELNKRSDLSKIEKENFQRLIEKTYDALNDSESDLEAIGIDKLPGDIRKLYIETRSKVKDGLATVGEARIKIMVTPNWLKDVKDENSVEQKKQFEALKTAATKIPESIEFVKDEQDRIKNNPSLINDLQWLNVQETLLNQNISTLSEVYKSIQFDEQLLVSGAWSDLLSLKQKLSANGQHAMEDMYKMKLYVDTAKLQLDPELAPYIRMNGDGVVTKTDAFKKLPPDKQAKIIQKLSGLRLSLASEMDEKLANQTDHVLISIKKKIDAGDLYDAKEDLLKFLKGNSPDTNPRKIDEAKSYLRNIGISEVKNALGILNTMRSSINEKFDWGLGLERRSHGALNSYQANRFLDGQEAMLKSAAAMLANGEVDTLEQAKTKLMEMKTEEYSFSDLQDAQSEKAKLEEQNMTSFKIEKETRLSKLRKGLSQIRQKLSQPYEDFPNQLSSATQRKARDEQTLKSLEADIARYSEMSVEQFRTEKIGEVESKIQKLLTMSAVNDIRTGFSIDMNRGAATYFDIFAMQAKLSEPDPIKRQENLLSLAQDARDRGEPETARMLFDLYFTRQKDEAEKRLSDQGLTREKFKDNFLKDKKTMAKIDIQVNVWKEKYKKENKQDATEEQIENAKSQMIENMVSSGYCHLINSNVNSLARQGDDKWKQEWRKQYQSIVALADVGQTGTFENWWSDEEWNKLPAKVAIGASIIIVSGAVGSAAVGVLGLSSELAVGASLATRIGYSAVQLGVEGTVFESTRGALTGVLEGDWTMYSSPTAYFKAVGQSILTFGVLKGVGIGFSRFKGAIKNGTKLTEEEALAAYEKSLEEGIVAKGAEELGWWGAKTTVEGTALTGMSAGQAWLMGENFTAKDFVKGVGDNFIFSAAIGGVHEFTGLTSDSKQRRAKKETKVAIEAIRDFADNAVLIDSTETALKSARESGNTKEVQRLEGELISLREKSKTLENNVHEKLVAETQREISDTKTQIDIITKRIENGQSLGENVDAMIASYNELRQYLNSMIEKLTELNTPQKNKEVDKPYSATNSSSEGQAKKQLPQVGEQYKLLGSDKEVAFYKIESIDEASDTISLVDTDGNKRVVSYRDFIMEKARARNKEVTRGAKDGFADNNNYDPKLGDKIKLFSLLDGTIETLIINHIDQSTGQVFLVSESGKPVRVIKTVEELKTLVFDTKVRLGQANYPPEYQIHKDILDGKLSPDLTDHSIRDALQKRMTPVDFTILDTNYSRITEAAKLAVIRGGRDIVRDVTFLNGEVRREGVRVYNGAELGQGAYGVVSDAYYVQFGSTELHQGVSKVPHASDEQRNAFAHESYFAEVVRLVHANSGDPSTSHIIRPVFASNGEVVYEKVTDQDGKSYSLDKAVDILDPIIWERQFAGAVKGLSALHRLGISHNDFKPANIMAGRDGGVLIDIGSLITNSDIISGRVRALRAGDNNLYAYYTTTDVVSGQPRTDWVPQDGMFNNSISTGESLARGENNFSGDKQAVGKSLLLYWEKKGYVSSDGKLKSDAPQRVKDHFDMVHRLSVADQHKTPYIDGDPSKGLDPIYIDLHEVIDRIEGRTISLPVESHLTETQKIKFERLRTIDPVGYDLIRNHFETMPADALEAILHGNKDVITTNGQSIVIYDVSVLGEGQYADVRKIVMIKPSGEPVIAALRRMKRGQQLSEESVNNYNLVSSWNDPAIIKPLVIGDDFVILESGFNKIDYTDVHTVISDPKVVAQGLSDVFSAYVNRFEGNHLVHTDLHEGNLIFLQDEKSEWHCKIIDTDNMVDISRFDANETAIYRLNDYEMIKSSYIDPFLANYGDHLPVELLERLVILENEIPVSQRPDIPLSNGPRVIAAIAKLMAEFVAHKP